MDKPDDIPPGERDWRERRRKNPFALIGPELIGHMDDPICPYCKRDWNDHHPRCIMLASA